MTVALEVFAAFVLDDTGVSGRRGAKRRRGKDEEEEELKGLKAAQDVEAKKAKLTATFATKALRYLQGLDAYVAQGKKRKEGPAHTTNNVYQQVASDLCIMPSIKRPKNDDVVVLVVHIQSMPNELLWHTVTSYLSAKDVCMLSSSCHFFAGLARSEELWKTLFERDFGMSALARNQFYTRFTRTWLWLYRSKSVVFKRKEDIKGSTVGSFVDQNVRFEGDWVDGRFTGYGLAVALPGEGMWDEGVMCEGQWLDGALHGFGRESFPDGEFLEGTWVNNSLSGQGMRRWPDGRVYKGDFKDGLPDGKGLMTYALGAGSYIGAWKDGQRHGQGVMIYGDKSKYAGLWCQDKRSGGGVLLYADGSQYKGEWMDDMRHGKGVMKWASGNIRLYEGNWRNDRQDGRGICYFADGNRFEGQWMQNKVVTSLVRSL